MCKQLPSYNGTPLEKVQGEGGTPLEKVRGGGGGGQPAGCCGRGPQLLLLGAVTCSLRLPLVAPVVLAEAGWEGPGASS